MEHSNKILFIDDDGFFISIMANALEKNKFSVEFALSGKAGVEAARTKKPALILLDLVMSGIDGYATLALLKADPIVKDIPVAILSNEGTDEQLEKSHQMGAVDHLVKMNFTPEQLVARIKELLKM